MPHTCIHTHLYCTSRFILSGSLFFIRMCRLDVQCAPQHRRGWRVSTPVRHAIPRASASAAAAVYNTTRRIVGYMSVMMWPLLCVYTRPFDDVLFPACGGSRCYRDKLGRDLFTSERQGSRRRLCSIPVRRPNALFVDVALCSVCFSKCFSNGKKIKYFSPLSYLTAPRAVCGH